MPNNDKIFRWLRFAIMASAVLVAVAIAYGALNVRVSNNTEDIRKTALKAETTEKVVIGLQKDIEYIKDGIDEIQEKLK